MKEQDIKNNGWYWNERDEQWQASLSIGDIEGEDSPYEIHVMRQGTLKHKGVDYEIGFCCMRGYYIQVATYSSNDKILTEETWQLLMSGVEAATKSKWLRYVENNA